MTTLDLAAEMDALHGLLTALAAPAAVTVDPAECVPNTARSGVSVLLGPLEDIAPVTLDRYQLRWPVHVIITSPAGPGPVREGYAVLSRLIDAFDCTYRAGDVDLGEVRAPAFTLTVTTVTNC